MIAEGQSLLQISKSLGVSYATLWTRLHSTTPAETGDSASVAESAEQTEPTAPVVQPLSEPDWEIELRAELVRIFQVRES